MKSKVPINEKFEIDDLDVLLSLLPTHIRNHSRRVAVCSAIITEYAVTSMSLIGISAGMTLPVIAHLGGTCHDIGKLMTRTSRENGNNYSKHPGLGAVLLERHKDEYFGNEPEAQMVLDIVRYHHEQADGSGFPEGLKSGKIPVAAGICCAANKLDHYMDLGRTPVIDERRVFKKLEAQTGKQFCEYVWVYLERAWPRLMKKYAFWAEENSEKNLKIFQKNA